MSNTTDLKNPPGFNIDFDLLQEFERGLDPHHPESSPIPARVLGYGEISTVFSIQAEAFKGLAFKRLPIFNTSDERVKYLATHQEYNRLLEEEVGIRVSPHGYAVFTRANGRPIFYIIQQEETSDSVGHRAIHLLSRDQVLVLFSLVLKEMRKVWDYNARQDRVQAAIDGQISNWSIQGFEPSHPALGDKVTFHYLDTSTPFFRIEGKEQLEPELFLRSAPSYLRWVLRLFFLEDVINRYYDFRRVVIDVIANFYKEQKPEYIPDLIRAANDFFAGDGASSHLKPIEEKEVRDYYQEDAAIFSIYQSMRKLDRFLHTRLLRREYPYTLPEKIKR